MAKHLRHGLRLPCTVIRVLDGDTVEIKSPFGSDKKYKVRLQNCWVLDDTDKDVQAKKFLEEKLLGNLDSDVHINFDGTETDILLRLTTLQRWLGYLYYTETEHVNGELVRLGLATIKKPK